MTDYDGIIAHLKLVAMRELRKRANAPFSIPQGDLPGFYQETLDAVVGPFAQRLMAALIGRDQAEQARADLQARVAELEKPMSDAELREYARGMGWVLRAS